MDIFQIFYLTLKDYQNFPGTAAAFFQAFPVLEIATIKFKNFPSFPGPSCLGQVDFPAGIGKGPGKSSLPTLVNKS